MDEAIAWAKRPIEKYAEFEGRARRKEYWYYALALFVAMCVLSVIQGILHVSSILTSLLALATLVPNIAVGIRRLHDTNRSGWWLLIALIPIVGGIVLIVFMATEGTRGPNQYGPDPLEGEQPARPAF